MRHGQLIYCAPLDTKYRHTETKDMHTTGYDALITIAIYPWLWVCHKPVTIQLQDNDHADCAIGTLDKLFNIKQVAIQFA